MPMANILAAYQRSVAAQSLFINEAFRRYRNRNYKHAPDYRAFITEASFLRDYVSWETFLEQSCLAYMTGDQSIQGNRPTLYVNPRDLLHANEILTGTLRYVDWSNVQTVRMLCNLFFVNGEPYRTFLSGIYSDLEDMRIIRNRAAHITTSTQTQLDTVATRRLQKVVTGISAADLLVSVLPATNPPTTVLDFFISQLDSAAIGISNY